MISRAVSRVLRALGFAFLVTASALAAAGLFLIGSPREEDR